MSTDALRAFFLWCTILNGGCLVLSSLVLMLGGDWVFRLHGRWFAMPRETFNRALYSLLGLYKILVITFNLVPYLALVIIG